MSNEMDILHHIYWFDGEELPSDQSEDACKEIANLFSKFAKHMTSKEDENKTDFSSSHFKKLSEFLAGVKSEDEIRWFPEYGCVLLVNNDENLQRHDSLYFALLGLDSFERVVHSTGDKFEFTARANSFMTDMIGPISRSKRNSFFVKFRDIFDSASRNKGADRSSSGKRQGHQKTPAFIKALLLQVLRCNCSTKRCKCGQNVLPEGGCTDVGLHTGGRARCTEYELVKSVCEWKLKMMYLNDCQTSSWCHEPSFDLVMMYFDTYILETSVSSAEKEFCFSCDGVPQRCARLWKIQKSLCCRSTTLADHGYTVDSHSHLLKVKSLKERIYKLFSSVQDMHKMRNNISFRLPSFECLESPQIVPVELGRSDTDREETSTETLNARALEYVPSFDFQNYSISSAHKWALHTKIWHETVVSLQAFMSDMERIFWKLEKYLDNPLEDIEDIVRLSEILDIYREYVEKLLKMSKFAKSRTVRLRSIELLASWLVYCVIFNGIRGHYPKVLLRKFGVALRYQDLSHLVLQNEKHSKVLLRIVSFLKSNCKEGSEIFCSRKDQTWSSATFKMGYLYTNQFLKETYMKEKESADSRVDLHWKEVQQKQKLSKHLRSELETLQKNYESENDEWLTARNEYREARYHWENMSRKCPCTKWNRNILCTCADSFNAMENAERIFYGKEAKKDRTYEKISPKQSEISLVETPPDSIIQPLPQDEYRSMVVLFFLHMPEEFAILAKISFISQQLLVPKPRLLKYYTGNSFSTVDVLEQLKVNKSYISWFDHYNKYRGHRGEKKNTNAASLVKISMKKEVKRNIGPSNVLHYSTEMDGVFYPDESNIRLAWFGGKLSSDKMDARFEFNPFKISFECSAAYFTEDLPENLKELQWCMYPAKENDIVDRGNKPYASQDLKPAWLDREGFLHFARIRENPNIMLHKLCLALKSESVPLQHECVQVLIAQSAYQVGTISSSIDDNCTIFEWKRDFETIREVCKTEVTSIIEKYAESPSLYAAFPFLAEIFGFLLNFNYGEQDLDERTEDEEKSEKDPFFSKNEDTTCVLSTSAISWASACDDDISKADPECISSIRSRQVIYFRTAVLSLVQNRHLTITESESILKCVVRARNAFVEEKDDLEIRNKLDFLCLNALCENEQYTRNISSHKNLLNNALRMVIASAPAKLKWEKVSDTEQFESNYVFIANNSLDGHEYVVNILTGTVLVDGMPPTILPQHITEDKRYKRIFGGNIFEIVNRDEWMETRQPVHGKLYRFRSTGDDILLIEESSDMNEATRTDIWKDPLELLHFSDIEYWAEDLPKKLKVSYSHWCSRKRNITYFRGIDFREREIHFTHNMKCCEKIPKGIINKVRTQKDVLVMHQSSILDIFERVESKETIHSYLSTDEVSGEKSFRVELFRLGLTFTLVKGEGIFKCNEVVGYQLASIQHLEALPSGFSNYLLLENSEDKSLQRIIVPFGEIDKGLEKGQVVIHKLSRDLKVADEDVYKEIHIFQYDVHPRLHTIISSSLCGRLFLACIFAASLYEIPYKALGMTEEEQAMTLLRECHLNRPMKSAEIQVLQNFTRLCKGKSASLLLLAHDLSISAQEFKFLHPSSYNTDISLELQRHDVCNSISVYLNNAKGTSKRLQLSSSESRRILASPYSPIFVKKSCIFNSMSIVNTPPISQKSVQNFESKIQDIRKSATLRNIKKRPFPINTEAKTKLEEIMYEDLSKSWDIYSKRKEYHPHDTDKLLPKLVSLAEEVCADVKKIETYIRDALVSDSKSVSNAYRRLMNNIPTITKTDMMKIACDRDLAVVFNPILSSNDVKKIHEMILLWLELCVLQDKCAWLIKCASDKSRHHDFFVEISSIRTWETCKHPYWLVFEAEQGIRIRPEQYEIANHLIQNNGSIVQLNCGQGKTRVILPMLVLYFANQRKFDRIPRLHILNTLIGEFCEYFETALSASVMNIKLYTMPFRRDVEINERTISSMQDLVSRCMSDRGCLIVAPEHRLSMEMKVKELYLEQSFDLSKRLQHIVNTRWQDIFDEIDEILHYRYQLIYSIGSIEPLPQMNCRWLAAEILLEIFIENGQLINGIKLIPRNRNEACPRYTMNNVNHNEFREKMTEMLLKHPHLAVQWMQKHSRLEEISKVISDPTADPQLLKKKIQQGHFDQVLAFRGLLAHDLLLHCLKKRYRVDFGFREGSKKQLSVPFRGADTPSERSEFSHPDTAIVLSLLSYYSRGLLNEDLTIAFQALLKKGKEFQHKTYAKWLSRSKTRLDAKALKTIDRIEKIDLTNSAQFNTLFEFFHMNPETINFWLNSFVFPRDLDQYPHRLVGSPWHLADNKDGCSIGFSGTNDNHLVMPLQMKQHLPWNTTDPVWCDLLATNGKMIDVIVEKTKSVHVLADGIPSEKLLQFISSDEVDQVDALIDCGALLVGYSCEEVAKYILQNLIEKSRSLKGVTFYDDKREDWMILEKSGRCLARVQSSLQEKETFVVFDEPRCRGVDMKLRSDAVAVMTLGQNLTKDKFMQAAGRMRKLHSNQSLIIIGEKQICQEIGKIECLNTLSILEWIVKNTVESIVKGLQIWSDQGIFFQTSKEAKHSVLDEKSDLSSFYGRPIRIDDLSKSATISKSFHFTRTSKINSNRMETRATVSNISTIIKRCEDLGAGYKIITSATDEECEREMQREVEEEEEEEIEVAKQIPCQQHDWDYSTIFSYNNACQLPINVLSFYDMLLQNMSNKENIRKVQWPNNLYCTPNFMKTIKVQNEYSIDEYLRLPDCFVQFPDTSVVLLSDREGAKIYDLFLHNRDKQNISNYFFGHFAYESDPKTEKSLRCDLNEEENMVLSSSIACSMKLFNGDTRYSSNQREAVKRLLSFNESTHDFAQAFVNARDKGKDFEMSDLEQICEEIVLELEQ